MLSPSIFRLHYNSCSWQAKIVWREGLCGWHHFVLSQLVNAFLKFMKHTNIFRGWLTSFSAMTRRHSMTLWCLCRASIRIVLYWLRNELFFHSWHNRFQRKLKTMLHQVYRPQIFCITSSRFRKCDQDKLLKVISDRSGSVDLLQLKHQVESNLPSKLRMTRF